MATTLAEIIGRYTIGATTKPLRGSRFVITGTLSVRRDQAQRFLAELGAEIASGISKRPGPNTFLLTSEVEIEEYKSFGSGQATTKLKAAVDAKVPVLSEADLVRKLLAGAVNDALNAAPTPKAPPPPQPDHYGDF